MAQSDYVVDGTGGGLSVRQDIVEALEAAATNNSGDSAPSPSFPNQWWADTLNNRLKLRNKQNTAWIDKGPLEMQVWAVNSTQPQDFPSGTSTILFNQAQYSHSNPNGAYNTASSEWTCPRTGWWRIATSALVEWTASARTIITVGFFIDSSFSQQPKDLSAGGQFQINLTETHYISQGSIVRPSVFFSGNTVTRRINPGINSYFMAYEVR